MEYHGDWEPSTTQQNKYSLFKQYFKKKPNSKFSNFIGMIFGFRQELNSSIVQAKPQIDEKEILKEQLREEVNSFIELKDKRKLEIIIKRGYEIDNFQCKKLMDLEPSFTSPIIQSAIDYNLKNHFIKELIKYFKEVKTFDDPDDNFYEIYTRAEFNDYNKNQLQKIANLAHSMWSRVDTLTLLGNDDLALEFLSACQNVKRVTQHHKFSGRVEFEDSLDKFIEHLEREKSDVIDARFNAQMDKYSSILSDSFDSMKKNIVQDIISNAANFKEQDIPQDSRDIIASIKDLHRDISGLDIQKKLELDNLYLKRLPQVIKEYISIAPTYREKLISHNESPDQLLNDSLSEIKDKIEAIFEGVQDTQFKQMKITNRYLKKV